MGGPRRLRMRHRSWSFRRATMACVGLAKTDRGQGRGRCAICSSLVVRLRQSDIRDMSIGKIFCLPISATRRIMCLTGMRLRSFDQSGFVTDASLAEAEYFAWTQWELTYSVLASTFPSTQRSFLDLVTFYNNGYHTEKETSRSRTLPAGESFKMTVLSSKATASDPRSNDERILVRDDEEDHDDASSQEMIITKKFTYEVLVENAIPPTNPPLERHFNFEDNRKFRLPVPDEDLKPEYTGRKRVQQTL